MLRVQYLAGAALITTACAIGSPAHAQDGLATIHDWVRIGNKTCMKDHFHSGAAAGQPSKKQAEAQAVGGWASFTAWEYGDHWARWRLAESRSVKCNKEGAGWACTVEARPCKPGRR
jgi:hypothetical protein